MALSKKLLTRYLPKEHRQFSIIEKSEDIREMVKKYSDVTEVDITNPEFDLPADSLSCNTSQSLSILQTVLTM